MKNAKYFYDLAESQTNTAKSRLIEKVENLFKNAANSGNKSIYVSFNISLIEEDLKSAGYKVKKNVQVGHNEYATHITATNMTQQELTDAYYKK